MKWASTNTVATIVLLVKQGWKLKICFICWGIVDHWGRGIAALSVSLHHNRSLLDLTLEIYWSGQITEKIVLNFCNLLLAGVIFLFRQSAFHRMHSGWMQMLRLSLSYGCLIPLVHWFCQTQMKTASEHTPIHKAIQRIFLTCDDEPFQCCEAEREELWCDTWRSLFYLLYIFNAKL